jgi:squalene synthase HpnC
MEVGTAEIRRWRDREAGENFPVALRFLPRRVRGHLHAVYAVARLIDDVGDTSPGDRTEQLLELRAGLSRLWAGQDPGHPVLALLRPSIAACGLPEDAFQKLIEANLVDQRVAGYPTFEDLLGYCRLSADPVGRLVLAVFGQGTPENEALSDRVCTALQVLEHCQDVAEDHAAGRIYLPQRDLAEFGVRAGQLATGGPGDPGCRAVVTRQVDRAAGLLEEGMPLIGRLTGWARIAVAGYAAGGRATVRALRACGGDVWSAPVTPRRTDMARSMAALLAQTRRTVR